MKFIPILLLIIVPAFAQNLDETNSLEKLFQGPLNAGKTSQKDQSQFRVDQCEKIKMNLQNLLSGNHGLIINYQFKSGCDIQGKVHPKIFQPFFVKLNLKHSTYSYFEGQSTIKSDLQLNPSLDLEVRNGLLKGKNSSLKFEADYKFLPKASDGKYILVPLGGEIRIFEMNNKKTKIVKKMSGAKL